ncbi:DNA gyrase/topoisomerase IV subunit A [Haliscomenobacter sp.]|uniref:DNA gyrase/topoisomerase IV subunit A n=1 Tax=Haliscomenobacter sp. TaxID=2717303 RepID=UPI003BA9123A
MDQSNKTANGNGQLINLQGMYQDYFLDYASYVILERAVPHIDDGLKPVQRRILHAMKETDDGRFNKVANVIGLTMQYHPHGDAAIGDALVNMGQKELTIDTQGNWGDVATGAGAAAPRYIEGRLTKFALEVMFNPQTTEWQMSYDGRKREPVTLPAKFPLLLASGTDGIAVGLSTKIMPHNFIELIKASIDILKGKKVQIFPDFQTGAMVDVSDYNGGKRGGKIKIRALIEKLDKDLLAVKELPYGVTTESLIESIIKANDKGKIKIKKVVDLTSKDVEVQIELIPGTSPDVTIDALYAFTDCEVSISPNACVIHEDRPRFMTVEEILEHNTFRTRDLLQTELEIKLGELLEKWHMASLEKIFIENRIYHQIEECESWEEVLTTIDRELRKYVVTPVDNPGPNDQRMRLMRDITEDDIVKLTEIRIKRISKYNTFKADEHIAALEAEMEQVRYDLEHITDFTIAYYKRLLEKYGKGRERRTKITSFEYIQATEVVANNAKLFVNYTEGFIGFGLKKDENNVFVSECSDIDDIIVFRADGRFMVKRIADKVFVGKDIIHAAVWKKNDERTTYNLVYSDGANGRTFAKRFNVTAITRDKEYVLTSEAKGSKLLYFTANPNGEAEVVNIQLTQASTAKKKMFDYDFKELAIKGRSSQGNLITKYPVRKVSLKEAGRSTIGALKVYIDDVSGRLNNDGRGRLLGEFDTGELMFILFKDGTYEMAELDMTRRFNLVELYHLGKFDPEMVISAVHYDGNKGLTMVKRFRVETTKLKERFSYLTDHKDSRLLFATIETNPQVRYSMKLKNKKMQGELNLADFIDVKGWKALGNKLSDQKLTEVELIPPADKPAEKPAEVMPDKLHAGDSIEFDVDGQTKLF